MFAATQPTGEPTTDKSDAGADDDVADARAHRRKLLIIAGAAGAVVVIAVIAFALTSRGGDDNAAPAVTSSTVLLPSPTPTVPPVARASTTAFAKALPVSVLQFALASSAPAADWVTAGAIEASTETYSDGGTGTVVVIAGQWETPEEAAQYALGLVAALPAAPAGAAADATAGATESAAPSGSATAASATFPQTGDVTVGGQKVGTFTIVDAGTDSGVAVWSNGTAVFRATGPLASIHDVYAAFPL